MRSMLFVPGDSQKKLARAEATAADALILDLEDAVAADRLPLARRTVGEYLLAHRERNKMRLWVRINPLSSNKALDDLAAVVAGAPDGILLPKITSAADIVQLEHYLSALEARDRVAQPIKIMPVATETAPAMFNLGGLAGCSPRLWGVTWGAEDLSAAVGASSNRGANGELDFTYRMARSLCLLAAVAAGVEPIDTAFTNFRDSQGLFEEAQNARRAGFTGKIAIHPGQIEPINRAFTPSAEEIEYARRVVEAFTTETGTVALDGKMLDMPHLKQARRVLAAAKP